MIGVDRLDYSKGPPDRLKAIECLLQHHAEYCGDLTFLQIAAPSRTDVPEYVDICEEIEVTCGHINGRFSTYNWVPIRYVNKAYSQAALAGLYQAARVGLVTPMRDGMNLVAKEYVATQDPADPGVLILSQFAGAASDASGGDFPLPPLLSCPDLIRAPRATRLDLCWPPWVAGSSPATTRRGGAKAIRNLL